MTIEKSELSRLKTFMNFGLGIAVATAFTAMSFKKFQSIILSDLKLGILIIILFGINFFWFMGWIYFDLTEVDLLDKVENKDAKHAKSLQFSSFISIIFIAILLGTLISFTTNLSIYCPLIILITLMSSISHFMVQRRFADVARKREKPNERDVTDELIDYYLFIPLFIIDFCMMILGFGAFFLHYLYLQKHNTNLEYYAYLIIILTLVAHESILWFWRIRRNNAIGKIKAG